MVKDTDLAKKDTAVVNMDGVVSLMLIVMWKKDVNQALVNVVHHLIIKRALQLLLSLEKYPVINGDAENHLDLVKKDTVVVGMDGVAKIVITVVRDANLNLVNAGK